MNKKLKIGFVDNLFGTPKGHSYVVRDMVKMLKNAGHEVHMYRIKDNPISGEFMMPDTLQSVNEMNVPAKEFIAWCEEHKFDRMVFNEYNQWWTDKMDKLQYCNEVGIKTVGYLVWEKFDKNQIEHYKLYDKIICPTAFQTKLFRKNKLYNATHVRWATDINEIDAVSKPLKNEKKKVTFYHCAGSGGVGDRKNSQAVIEAYKKIQDENTDLIMTHLGSKVFNRREIISFMKFADVLVNTSKWDTIGLNTIEANACGIPVIVCDAKPMNELVYDNVNGLLAFSEETKSEHVTCPSNEVDIDSLANKMEICKNEILLDVLKTNAKKFAETNFDWNKNKKDFLNVFEVQK